MHALWKKKELLIFQFWHLSIWTFWVLLASSKINLISTVYFPMFILRYCGNKQKHMLIKYFMLKISYIIWIYTTSAFLILLKYMHCFSSGTNIREFRGSGNPQNKIHNEIPNFSHYYFVQVWNHELRNPRSKHFSQNHEWKCFQSNLLNSLNYFK